MVIYLILWLNEISNGPSVFEKLAVSLNLRHGDLLQSFVTWNPIWTFGVIKRWAERFPRQPNPCNVNQLVDISTNALSEAQLHTNCTYVCDVVTICTF